MNVNLVYLKQIRKQLVRVLYSPERGMNSEMVGKLFNITGRSVRTILSEIESESENENASN